MAGTRTEKAILAFFSNQSTNPDSKAADNIVQEAADRLMKESYQTKKKVSKALKGQFTLLEVQYNPLTLNFDGSGGDTELNSSQEDNENTVKQQINPGTVSLSMDLVVDGEKTRERTLELLQRVEREWDRKVIFCWGNMLFPGEMTQADAQYTMFSNTGEPQMGKISITISQNSPEESSYWKRAFESCFQTL